MCAAGVTQKCCGIHNSTHREHMLLTKIRKLTISLGDAEGHPSFYRLWQKTEKNAQPLKQREEQFLANKECKAAHILQRIRAEERLY